MRIFWLLQMAVVVLGIPSVYLVLHRGDPERALRVTALILAGMNGLFFGLFAIGEALADPGGWAAVVGTAAWLLPLLALGLLAWHRPDRAVVALAGLLLGFAAVSAWSTVAPDAWAAFENANGPVRALLAFALATPLAVLGWRRPLSAGIMLIALPALPLLLVVVSVARGLGSQGWPIVLVTAPAALIGGCYLGARMAAPSRGSVDRSQHQMHRNGHSRAPAQMAHSKRRETKPSEQTSPSRSLGGFSRSD